MSKFGEELAKILAEYWVAKMCYLYEQWATHDYGDHVFTDEECAGFVEPEACTRSLY